MFWTCDEACTANRRQFEAHKAEYSRLNKDYLRGVAEVRKRKKQKK